MAVIQADFEVAEVGVVVRHDLVISVDPNTDAVVQTEMLQLDREDKQHAVVDRLVKLVRVVGNTFNFTKVIMEHSILSFIFTSWANIEGRHHPGPLGFCARLLITARRDFILG